MLFQFKAPSRQNFNILLERISSNSGLKDVRTIQLVLCSHLCLSGSFVLEGITRLNPRRIFVSSHNEYSEETPESDCEIAMENPGILEICMFVCIIQ